MPVKPIYSHDGKAVAVLRGLPGSGKSHAAAEMERIYGPQISYDSVICSTDDFFEVDGEYRFDPTQLTEAHRTCFRKFVDAVNQERALIIVDNTNIHAAEFAPYVTYAAAYGYEVKLITVWCALEKAMARNIHKVPFEVILKMYSTLLKNESVPPFFTHEVILNG